MTDIGCKGCGVSIQPVDGWRPYCAECDRVVLRKRKHRSDGIRLQPCEDCFRPTTTDLLICRTCIHKNNGGIAGMNCAIMAEQIRCLNASLRQVKEENQKLRNWMENIVRTTSDAYKIGKALAKDTKTKKALGQ